MIASFFSEFLEHRCVRGDLAQVLVYVRGDHAAAKTSKSLGDRA